MRMRDAGRHSHFLRCRQWEYTQSVDVAVHNRPLLFVHQTNQLTTVTNRMLVRRYAEYTTTQSSDFLFRNARGILIDKEIKLHFAAVDIPVVVHHYRFNTAANHFADNLSYANRLLRTIHAGFRIMRLRIDHTHITYCFPCTSELTQHLKLPFP